MTKYFMILATMVLLVACSSNSAKNDADTATIDSDTPVTDDAAMSDADALVTCERDGVTYQVGDFIEVDCNTCQCDEYGSFQCTLFLCDDGDLLSDGEDTDDDVGVEDDGTVTDDPLFSDEDQNTCLSGEWKTENGVVSECAENQWVVRRISRQWGTASEDEGNSVAVDGAGSIYVTGYTEGTLEENLSLGSDDIFLAKWEIDGSKTWIKQWGTSEYDIGKSIVVDGLGGIYVTGFVEGAFEGNTNAGSCDIFLAKWNVDGTKAWAKQWGTSFDDYGFSVTADGEGNIYITGLVRDSLDGNTPAGYEDIFLTKWNADGTKAWTKQWGTSDVDVGNSVAVDEAGDIYVAGYTYGALDGNTKAGGMDIFLTKWHADSTKVWTKQWGTSSGDAGHSVVVDGLGNIYVTGETAGSLDGNTSAGGSDIFLTKWNADGTKAWTKQWGTSPHEDVGFSVAVDGLGSIYVAGVTTGALDGNVSAGYEDIFLTKWNADGAKAWTKQWGTASEDVAYSVAIDGSRNLSVAGRTVGALDGNAKVGYSDAFLSIIPAE